MTAPLPGYRPPEELVFTPAMRAEDDEYRDQRAARVQQDRAVVDGWFIEAREKTFSRLDAWLEHGRTT